LNIDQLSWAPLPSREALRYSSKQIPEEAKVFSLDVQGSELAAHPPRCPKHLQLSTLCSNKPSDIDLPQYRKMGKGMSIASYLDLILGTKLYSQ